MARLDRGSSGFGVPPTDRVAEASFYDQRDRDGQDRRRRQSARPHHTTLIDLLFEEVDEPRDQPGERPDEKQGEKQGQQQTPRQRPRPRPNFRKSARPAAAGPPAPEPRLEPHAQHPLEPEEVTDRRIRLAAEEAEEELRFDDKVREARHIATQLRYCLCQHTETARKVSSYLHALLMITHGQYKPKLVIEV
ncbi:MAG: hypothetical protein WCO00_00275 [Rhodospirillaceae bacterium]